MTSVLPPHSVVFVKSHKNHYFPVQYSPISLPNGRTLCSLYGMDQIIYANCKLIFAFEGVEEYYFDFEKLYSL